MKVTACQIVGATTSPRGKAAFDRANVIVESRDTPGVLLQVSTYISPDELDGKSLDQDDFDALVRTEQSVRFDVPIAAASGTAFWVLRPSFDSREAALEELRTSGALLSDHIILPDGSFGCLVRERLEALDLRDRWAAEADKQAIAWAKGEHWERARTAASRAYVIARSMSPERIAMLALAYDRIGNSMRAKGYLEMARNSRGEDFAAQVSEKRTDLERLIAEVLRFHMRTKRAEMQESSRKGIHATLERMRRKSA